MRNRNACRWAPGSGFRVARDVSAALGLKVLKHERDPRTPASNVVNTLIDSSTASSDAADRSWVAFRELMRASVPRAASPVARAAPKVPAPPHITINPPPKPKALLLDGPKSSGGTA